MKTLIRSLVVFLGITLFVSCAEDIDVPDVQGNNVQRIRFKNETGSSWKWFISQNPTAEEFKYSMIIGEDTLTIDNLSAGDSTNYFSVAGENFPLSEITESFNYRYSSAGTGNAVDIKNETRKMLLPNSLSLNGSTHYTIVFYDYNNVGLYPENYGL